MPTSTNTHLLIETDTSAGELEVYLNADNKIFFQNSEIDATHFWFTLSKEDWESLKTFIDHQYSRSDRIN